jgi:hypothetical protein
MTVDLTENDVRAVMAEGKKLVILNEVNGYELCVPEDGSRPVDSFWRKKEKSIDALVAVVKMSRPHGASTSESEPHESEPRETLASEPRETLASEPRETLASSIEPLPVKLRVVPQKYDKYEVPVRLERGEKICIDCQLPYPRDAFYTNSATKDGHQSRCKECDKKRRTEYNRGLHVKASERDDYIREATRKQAMEAVSVVVADKPYAYEGVSGGFLIFGYVR